MFAVADGHVQLYSMAGRSWGPKFKRQIPESWTARDTAARLLRTKTNQRSNDFNRKLYYPKGF
jgi:hypothetical protein